MTTIVKFPYNASRRAHARLARKSRNGTPEERAAKAPAAEKRPQNSNPLRAKIVAVSRAATIAGMVNYRSRDLSGIGPIGELHFQELRRAAEEARYLASEFERAAEHVRGGCSVALGGSDPIYAAIERHKAAGVAWDAAVNVRADYDEADVDETERLQDAVDNAWELCVQAGVDLINTGPTTLAGIVAAIGYLRIQMSDDGTYMPRHFVLDTGGDAQETTGWIDAFLDTIADAVAALDQQGGAA
jgi:hypothetical protein